jgi:hypothetical protein
MVIGCVLWMVLVDPISEPLQLDIRVRVRLAKGPS